MAWEVGELVEVKGENDASGDYKLSFSVARVDEVDETILVEYLEVRRT